MVVREGQLVGDQGGVIRVLEISDRMVCSSGGSSFDKQRRGVVFRSVRQRRRLV